jgi:hypothetical protein
MNEKIDNIDALHRLFEGFRLKHISLIYFDRPFGLTADTPGLSNQTADGMSRFEQPGHEALADVPGTAQHQYGTHVALISCCSILVLTPFVHPVESAALI